MSAYARFLEALDSNGFKYKADGRGRARAQCPSHSGDDLNLAVAIGDQGVLLRCHSYDCPAEDIARAVGLTMNDLFDADGRALYQYPGGHEVIRERTRDGKKIVQRNHPGPVTQLYRHPDSVDLADATEVVIVEGEKSVDAALRMGFPAVTTWPGGASNADKVDLTPLSGKIVHLIADHDEPGFAAMGKIATMLQGLATVATITTAPKDHQDIADLWLDGGEATDLIPFDPTNYVQGPSAEDMDFILKDLSEFRSKPLRWMWKGLIPMGAAVVFAGMGGVSKSTFALWLAGRVTRGLVDGALLNQPSHVIYVQHEDPVEQVVLPRAQVNLVDTAKFSIFGVPMKNVKGATMPMFPEHIGRLENAIKQKNAKVVIIDPIISTMRPGSDPNDLVAVRQLLDPINQLAQRLDITIICIAHTNKGSTDSRTSVTGSGAWVDATRGTLVFASEEPEADQDYIDVVFGNPKANYSKYGANYTYRVHSAEHMYDNGEVADMAKIQFLGPSTRTVDEVLASRIEDRRSGWLPRAIKDFIESSMGATTTKQILEEFKDQNPGTVRGALARLAKSGKIDAVTHGVYQKRKQGV